MEDNKSVKERRLTVRLFSYWEKLRGSRIMPTEEDIDPDHIEDLWEYCFLIHTKDLDKTDYNYTYIGDSILEAYRGGLSQNDVNGLISPNAEWMAESYKKIVESKKPIIDEGEFLNYNNQIVKYRQCLLPLGEGDEVKAIFGGMRYKIYSTE